MSKLIPLTQGKFAIVDNADFDWLNQWKWYAVKSYNTWYARRFSSIPMHRQIMSAPSGTEIDHRNHNGLDNRRQNLRFSTSAENQWIQRYSY
jgi:hypothetical protein